MNKIHRIVWSYARQCLVVVQENARSRGKCSGTAGSVTEARLTPWRRVLAALLMFMQALYPALAAAQTVILPDGRTQTTVANSGPVYNVSTGTMSGSNAFNSFNAFSVGAGNTVNLHVPTSAINLINIVRDQRTDVHGILNAIKDGRIGGNVWFANPHGFVVGASGVVNVGSLTLTTPTQGFVDDFFSAPGSPNQASVTQLLSGTAPRNRDGLVSILGRVNAIDGINLSAGAINVAGFVYSGARFLGTAPDFTDVVNANGLASATNVVVREGRIQIVADSDVTVSGVIAAPGGVGVRGGDIGINAGGNVELNAGANVSARGSGANSSGGTVNIWAGNDATARRGALVDASAGSSGDGGAIEFSAKNTVELAGGDFRADGTGGGKAGSVLIDPWNIVVSADILRGAAGYGTLPDGGAAAGANLTLLADNEITVNDNVTVSTRSVAGTTAADHATGASTANSGNLMLEAGSITLKSGSKLLAGTETGSSYSGGDVTLKATRNWTGEARIGVDNATITGRNVALTANATYNDSILTSWLPVVVPVTVSTIDINAGTIKASGTLNLGATSLISVSSSGLSPFGLITAVSASAVDVRGASVLTSGGNTTLASSSTVTSRATPGGPNPATLPGDAGVATNVIVSTAKTRVGDTSSVTVSGGTLDLTAKNAVTATTTADSTAGGAIAIGGTLALSEVTSVTQAVIDGSATTSSSALKVGAESTSVVTTSAKAASKGAKKQSAAEKAAAPSKSEAALAKYKDQTTTSDGSVDVAAAVAIANLNNITLADIASSGTQTSTGAATVSSKASSTSTVTADGSSASGTVGVGAAVGVNIGVLVNQARVTDNASVSSNGLSVSAVMATAGSKNSFVTTATSGAGASNVGVAGALGANVLVNTTVAAVEGDKDSIGSGAAVNANGGDVLVESANASESRLTVGASVKPATATEPAAVGVGASVGINVGVNTTVAEVGNGATITGANDLDLTAKGTPSLVTDVTGGAAGADVSVTPVVAVTVAVNTTTARLGTGSQLNLFGAYTSSAEQTSSSTTTATGQTQGNNVAVGASIALNNATDTVTAGIDREIAASGDVEVAAKSISRSSATATASVAGGEKATAADAPPAKPDGSAGETVDEKVTAQGDAAKDAGKKTSETAAASSPTSAGLAAAAASSDPDTKKAAEAAAANSPASAGLAVAAAASDSKTKVEDTKAPPTTEEKKDDGTGNGGGVSVAAAVGVNVGINTTTASIAKGKKISSSAGALKVKSAAQTDAKAKADGSQVNGGNTDVGVGAAVALNVGVGTNVAVIGDNADVDTKGVTVQAVMAVTPASGATPEDKTSEFGADAKSGAGANNVGVAGALAVNAAINTTVAAIEGDKDASGAGANVNATTAGGAGDVRVEAQSATKSTVVSGADVKMESDKAKVGIGASVGMNVAVNTTVAEIGDNAILSGGKNLDLNATADHEMSTTVTGGAAGAKVSITPLAALSMSVNTTTARLGTGTALDLTGTYSSKAEQTSEVTTVATGQTQGDKVAVGASVGLTVAVDTVTASVERDVDADTGVTVEASSIARSSTSATASVAGGAKEAADGKPAGDPATPATPGKTVDEQVKAKSDGGKGQGKAAAAAAPATTPPAGGSATSKLDDTKAPPTTEEKKDDGTGNGGGVSVAAAVGVNVGINTTTASIAKGKKISSSAGALKVKSAAQTDAKAKADGSQVNGGNTDVGVGAAVALNVGVGTNVAVIGDNADIDTKGVTVQAVMAVTPASGATPEDKTSEFGADAKSGAGANNVGVAGALAVNAAINTTVAAIEGDKDASGAGANVNATTAGGAGDVRVEAQSATKSTVVSGADVKMESDKAKVGIGASVGMNVAVNTTVAEIGDAAVLSGGKNLDLNATADHEMSTTVTGGAAGAKVSITPVAAVSIAVNTTTARAGGSATALGLSGALSAHADQTDTVTTKATGQAQGDVAVGASLAAAAVVETVSASVERSVSSSTEIDVGASSSLSLRTEAVAGAKGAKAAAKDPATGEEKPEAGTTVDEQKKTQLDSAKKRNDSTRTLDTDTKTPKAETPEVNKNDTTEVKKDGPPQKPTDPPTTNDKKQESKKVSVAAAIGVGVVVNQATATVGGAGRSVSTTGKMDVKATTDTNYETMATGEAVSDNIGIAAAVALTGTFNKTQANIAAGTTVVQADDINVIATANQNRDAAFRLDMAAEAVSGASGGDVAVAGSLAVVGNYNETRASIDEDVTIGTVGAPVGNVTVKADETSKLAARARAGALSTGKESKAGVGASFAAILAYNKTTAAAGYDTLWGSFYTPTYIYANSLTVAAAKHKVEFASPLDFIPKSIGGVQTWVKNFDFDTLDPLNYLGSNNYYTEAVAGAAAKGDAAVAGAFSVNLFMNTTEAYLGKNVNVTTSGIQAGAHPEHLGVEVAARSDTKAVAFAGAVAGAKQAGVGISNTDIVNFDETNASIGGGSIVKVGAGGTATDNGVKVTADASQVVANVSVSGGIATGSTGVGGVLGVNLSMNKAEASIGEAAQVQAEGNVTVAATNDTTMVMIAGGVGGGKEVGVGGAIALDGVWNRTLASIGKDAVVDAKKTITVTADADETVVSAVVSGAGGGKVGVAAALSLNVIVADTEASVGEGAKLNTSAGFGNAEKVAITARDDTVLVGVSGGGAGGGDAGVGAALETAVVVKKVKAFIADDTVADGKFATIKAKKEVAIDAASTEAIVSIAAGFAGGGKAGVGGSVSIGVVANDVQAGVGKSAVVDTDGNVLVSAQDDTTAVLTAMAGAGGGQAGVGGSLAVATLVGSTKAYVGESAQVNARGLGDAASVYTGATGKAKEDAKGLSVSAYNTENVITTDVSGAGGGNAGVAVSVSANVIANTAEAYIGRSAKINETNTAAGADQQVRIKAIDETVLVNNAGGAGFGGSAGVGAAANIGVIAKTTKAWIGSSALVNAKKAVELGATSSEVAVSGTLGFAIGGSAGVGASLGGVGLGNTTEAYIEDAAGAASATKVNVSGGDLSVEASDLATTTLLTGGGGGGGSAGVGGAIAVNVNASTTRAKIGNYAETNASGTTAVHADSVENTNTVTVAGAGGGSAGVGGAASIKVVVSKTEAGIGDNAKVNQDAAYKATGQDVDVKATDKIITVGVGGVGAGGGAAGVGGSADITVVLNTTSAYIGNNAKVSAVKDVTVDASSEKYVNSATFAGAGGGSAGVAGGISVISVGSLLDGEAKSGLSPKDENGNPTTTQKQADDLTTTSSVGDLLGSGTQSQETKGVLDGKASKMAISSHVGRTAPIDFKNTQAFIGNGAEVKAGEDVTVTAKDTTLAILAAGAGAGGGAAGVAGTLGVILLHDSAEAFIADNARVDAGKTVAVNAQTGENVFNVAVTGAGAGAAAVNGSIVVNVVSSDTSAYIGAADINKDVAMDAASTEQSVDVSAKSNSNLVAVAGAGNGAGAAAVGGVLNVNTLVKRTKAYIARDADVAADENVKVAAESAQNVVAVGASFGGAGAAAVSAAAEVNVVANVTEAFIGAARGDADKSTGAIVDSDGNVSVSAVDDTLVVALSAVGNGAGAAAVGGIVGANVISSQTRAYVSENSAVNARGMGAGTTVYSGTVGAAPGTLPTVPGGGSGDIDIDRDGLTDGNVGNGATLNTKTGSGTQSTVNPGVAKDADGNPIAGASGGLGTKGTDTVKGLSVLAMGNEKIITATIGVAGAGAAAVTGAATANVIVSQTEASIGDGAQINMSGAAGTDPSVRVRAADNTFMVQAGGTVTGAGAAAVSGTVNTGIVAKKTTARIGDADVKANDVEVTADSSEKVFTLTANVSIAGAAGVGAGVGVNVIANETSASIGAGADIDATDDISVTANQNSLLNVNTVAVAGGIAGVGGAFSVGVIANKTKAYVEGSDDLADRTTLNAGGTTAISAVAEENLVTATVSGAGGVAGVTGAFGVKVIKSDTDAYIGKNSLVTADEVDVKATDTIRVVSVGGAVTGGLVGVGGTVDATIVLNTTSAHVDSGADINAVHDVKVEALSDKLVNSTTFAGSGGAVGVAGAVSIVSVGSLLDGEAKSGLNGDDTGSLVDSRIKEDKVSTQLGSSEHVQGVKTDVANRTANQGVAGDLKGTATPIPLQNTQAFVAGGAQVQAGDNLTVTAADKTLAVVSAGAGAVGAFAGVAGTVGVVLLHDSAEAFIADGAEVDAGKTVTVGATTQDNVFNTGITGSGAAGVAAGGSVVVNVVTSDTAAYIGNADINRHSARNANQSVAVTADSASNIVTVAGAGGVAGGASIGGVINVNALSKETKAYIASGADVAAGKNVDVLARSAENVVGAGVTLRGAGLGAAGAVISANVVDNTTEAYIDDAKVDSEGNVKLSAVDDTLIVAVSAVANGAGGMGVGLNVGANVVTNETRAYVSGASQIDARGNAAGTNVYTGAISSTPGAMPTLPAGESGSADIDRDGASDGSVSGGASFNLGGKTIDPAAAKASDGSDTGAAGGLGAKTEETVKGLSVVAMNNEKMITATVGVALAGGRAQTGASTTNVISSVTDASIGDGAQINTGGATANSAVRVRAADNTLMVQVGGTFAGAGAMGLSGAIDSGIVSKQTYARIGDADVKASDVEVTADSKEDVYNVTVNAALAGGAGVGGAAGVDVVRNKTFAGIGAGADIDATGDIRVNAKQHSAIDLYTVSGAVAGLVGVSGAVSVGVIANETKAYVEDAATLNAAGTTAVIADANEKITSVTVSGAAGGLAGVAGAVGVKVVESKTEAFIGDNARVNQTRNGAAQDVVVSATDVVTLRGGGGTVALAGYAGVGATAEINIVRNTTTAYIGDAALVDADRDVSVSAASTKDVQSAAIAASGGLSVGIGGAVSVVTVGAKLDDDAQGGLSDPSGGGNTATSVDSQISQDKVSSQLGSSEHVQGMKTDVSGGIGSLGVASKMNESSTASLDKTRAYIGGGSKVKAGDDVTVTATDKVKLDIKVAGAAGGFVGIGGAIGVGITKSTTEAFVDASTTIDAVGDVSIAAEARNIDGTGSTVTTTAGAGGVVGASASVAVLDDASTTRAYLGSGAEVQRADTFSVTADTIRKATATTYGASAGGLAIGASIARSTFDGSTAASLGDGVRVGKSAGKQVQDVAVEASDESVAVAAATAGAAGILAGSGADAKATMDSDVTASTGSGVAVVAQNKVGVEASAQTRTDASAFGVNIGAGSVGASLATARSNATVGATIGANNEIGAVQLDVLALKRVGTAPTALARATGASGGLLLGANATLATAESSGATSALVGGGSTLTVSGTTTVQAESNSQQTSSGIGFSGGFIALGADYSRAKSTTLTEAVLGDDVKLAGGTLQVLATGEDTNYAYGVAGSGGVASAPFSEASTTNNSQTYARTGSGDASRKIDVTNFFASADHTARFNSWMDSTNASLIGVSGAKASNSVNSRAEAHVGTSGYVQADNFALQAHNDVIKQSPATIPGLTTLLGAPLAAPAWNVNSSSGGLADFPAAGSTTTITTNALAQIGAGAHVEQTGSIASPGTFALDAWNSVTAADKVKMSSGGAISAASGKSEILADTDNATVRVGDFAEVTSLGDMALGARSLADLYSQAAVDVYGLVGVAPFGSSTARFLATNAIEVGAGATLDAGRDIRLAAGASSGDAPNQILTTARSDVYNNTAIPVSQDPVADAIIGTQSLITVGAGADLGAARNIGLYADKGSASASGVGIGKDIYRETLAAIASAISNAFGGDDVSFETRTGRAVKTQVADVEVNGTVHTGTQREQLLVIGPDGTATQTKGNISIKDTGWRDVAADIQARITTLDNLIQNYTTSDGGSDAAIAVAAYESEKKFLQRKLVELGYTKGAVGTSSLSALQVAQQTVAGMTTSVNNLTTTKNTLVTENTNLTNTNTSLTNTNTSLNSTNTSLNSTNTSLTSQNNTLNTVTIPALIAARAAYDPGTTEYINLTAQITTAQNTVTSNSTTISNNNTTISNNNTTISDNNSTIAANTTTIAANTTQIDTLTTDINRVTTQRDGIQAKIDTNQYSSTPAAGPMATFLTISDATAQLGNIFVRGDRLHGSGTLDSPGDAKITITNNGPNFLILRNLTILPDEGGKVYFNGVDVKSNADINQVNGAAGGAVFTVATAATSNKPAILVESKYDPLDPYYLAITPPDRNALAPDIVLQGDISNLRGSVKVDSAAGSIRLEQKRNADGSLVTPVETASVRAAEVEIKTRNGDFVQSYSNIFSNTSGSPLAVYKDPVTGLKSVVYTPETAGSGIVANGSVLIAARYLNINGIIQSGIPEWGVVVPAGVTVTVPGVGASGSFAQAQTYYNGLTPAQKAVAGSEYFTVSGTTVGGLTGNQWGAWEKITVRYNAKENRLELAGVQVQGGYIDLFGQIYNTSMAGGGELRVLDGYGQIKVDNQTGMPLWIPTLDTGRGVQGQIDITNITGLNAAGTPIITTTSYVRGAGASRTGYSYSPTTGLRYAMQVGKTTGRTDNYLVSNGAFFGIKALPDNLADYWVSGWYATDNPIPNNGEFLGQLPSAGTGNVASVTQSTSSASTPVAGASWFECNWWTLCAYGTYYTPFTVESSTRSITTVSLKADNSIGIKFIGQDNGLVNVNSTGNLVLNGSINNRSGDTTIGSAGSITQNGELPLVSGNNVFLAAGSGIGSSGQAVQVNVKDGGYLNATSGAGDVRVNQVLGDLRVGTVGGAGVANVYLEADRSLLARNASSVIQGQRVELVSDNGGIGLDGDPLVVRTGYTANQSQWPNYGLKASARDSINLKNIDDPGNAAVYSGNLLLIAAESAAGDVRIETSGSVIDNNPFATTDTRTEAELANLWDSLRLRGSLAQDKANEAVAAYKKGKEINYQLYWQLRKRQADGGAAYDPGYAFAFTTAERNALIASGMSEAEVSTLAANRTAQYHQLNTEVGGFASSYVSGYSYTVSAAEDASIRNGSSWTDAQLALSVGAGLLKNVTDTVTTIKQPNAKGRNVTLLVNDNIGSYDAPQEIDLTAGLSALTTAQKAALAAAERGDATFDNPTNPTKIIIVQPRPVNVEIGTGALKATATAGYALIGSEQDLRIDQISAAGDIRVKTAGSLVNAAAVPGAANIIGDNVIIEAANGGIGSVPDADGAVSAPLRISQSVGSGLIARAASDIWIESDGDLAADTLFSRGDLRLDAFGSILDFHSGESSVTPENNLLARNLFLTAQNGSIGSVANYLDAGSGRDGAITATALTAGKGVFLNGPAGEYFNIASVRSGDAAALSSATGMTVDGAVTAPGPISLVSGGTLTLTPKADVHATTLGVFLRAGALTMQDAQRMLDSGESLDSKYVAGDAARIRVDVGTIDLETTGDALITGIETGNGTESAIRVVSTAGRVLDNGDTRLDIIADAPPAAKLTISAALGIGDDPLDVRLLNLQATSGGVVDLAAEGPLNIVGISAGDRVLLSATGDITGDAVTSSGTGGTNPDQSISITSTTGSVTLASVSGQTDVSIAGQTGVAVDVVNVGTSVQLAGPVIDAVVNGGAGPVGGSVTGFGGGMATDVNLTLSGAGGFTLGNFWTAAAIVDNPLGALSIGNAIIGDRATFTNPQTLLLVDQHNKSLQSSDIQLYTAGAPFSLYLSGNHLTTEAMVIHSSPQHEVASASGPNVSAVQQGEDTLARINLPPSVSAEEDIGKRGESLVSFTGTPVATECDADDDPGCAR